MYEDILYLVFEDIKQRQKFLIARTVRTAVVSTGYEDLLPQAQFVPKK
jgi:hypothetical protein